MLVAAVPDPRSLSGQINPSESMTEGAHSRLTIPLILTREPTNTDVPSSRTSTLEALANQWSDVLKVVTRAPGCRGSSAWS